MLPAMAMHSPASIGPLLSQSYCERVNSCANIVLTPGNTSLGVDELGAIVTLRMNRKLIEKLKIRYRSVPLEERLRDIAAMDSAWCDFVSRGEQ
jgi:hypothetical protein